ncbi:MAG: aldo/keto reductase [Chloroflexi bacterium]|nr:aldo/keto reductase [Chloroflexota bacterium]
MLTTILGLTGIRVSRIGFGGLPIQRLEKTEAIKLVRHAIDNGINIFDTAIKYGASEEYIGASKKAMTTTSWL